MDENIFIIIVLPLLKLALDFYINFSNRSTKDILASRMELYMLIFHEVRALKSLFDIMQYLDWLSYKTKNDMDYYLLLDPETKRWIEISKIRIDRFLRHDNYFLNHLLAFMYLRSIKKFYFHFDSQMALLLKNKGYPSTLDRKNLMRFIFLIILIVTCYGVLYRVDVSVMIDWYIQLPFIIQTYILFFGIFFLYKNWWYAFVIQEHIDMPDYITMDEFKKLYRFMNRY